MGQGKPLNNLDLSIAVPLSHQLFFKKCPRCPKPEWDTLTIELNRLRLYCPMSHCPTVFFSLCWLYLRFTVERDQILMPLQYLCGPRVKTGFTQRSLRSTRSPRSLALYDFKEQCCRPKWLKAVLLRKVTQHCSRVVRVSRPIATLL